MKYAMKRNKSSFPQKNYLCITKLMKKIFLHIISALLIVLSVYSCKVSYSFTGINVSKDVKTFQVDYFPNNAPLIEPGLNEDFRNMLIDRIDKQTGLTQVKSGGDVIFQGEIVDYKIQPTALAAGQTAAQNRLTIAIKIDYTNNRTLGDNISKRYSWYYDYPASTSLNDIKAQAQEEILKTILDNLFNDTLAKW